MNEGLWGYLRPVVLFGAGLALGAGLVVPEKREFAFWVGIVMLGAGGALPFAWDLGREVCRWWRNRNS